MINNSLEPCVLPMPLRFNEEPTTEFKNNLDSLSVELLSYPTLEQLKSILIPTTNATWNDDPIDVYHKMSDKEIYQNLYDAFHFKYLPQALEMINLVFIIKGIDLQTVTHILRYRKCTFSAECSGDKWWTHKSGLVPNSIQNSKDFYERYKNIVEESKKLYCDMIDSKQISIMDARHILPRCLETYYIMRVNFLDLLNILKQRIDKQIQPEEDNLLAYQLYHETIKNIPFAINSINIHSPAMFYASKARTGKATNLYFPDSDTEKLMEYNEKDFIYQCTRDKLNGTDENAQNKFNEYFKKYDSLINETTKCQEEYLKSFGVVL